MEDRCFHRRGVPMPRFSGMAEISHSIHPIHIHNRNRNNSKIVNGATASMPMVPSTVIEIASSLKRLRTLAIPFHCSFPNHQINHHHTHDPTQTQIRIHDRHPSIPHRSMSRVSPRRDSIVGSMIVSMVQSTSLSIQIILMAIQDTWMHMRMHTLMLMHMIVPA